RAFWPCSWSRTTPRSCPSRRSPRSEGVWAVTPAIIPPLHANYGISSCLSVIVRVTIDTQNRARSLARPHGDRLIHAPGINGRKRFMAHFLKYGPRGVSDGGWPERLPNVGTSGEAMGRELVCLDRFESESGASMLEYALLAALIAVVCIVALT